ncbi:MAG TPA: methyltransferase domain-containing protein [Terriglobales bacterium]|nr:methyltransferase domain-containing protein [Terriglobales bacterium]
MKRVVIRELLDEDLGTPEEVRNSLLDLRWFNQNFGGFHCVTTLLARIATKSRNRSLTFLDVAGGTGDVADHVSRDLSNHGIKVRVTVLDRAISHMSGPKLNRVAGDALALPFSSHSFDVVGCNLFLHHLEPQDMIAFFNQALHLARIAVIASDLRRNVFHWLMASAGCFLYRSRITRNDAPASVRRAYTLSEMRRIAEQTAASSYEIEPFFFQRVGVILWKEQP